MFGKQLGAFNRIRSIISDFGHGTWLPLALLLFFWSGSPAKTADIFDATADFSSTNNPNGVWSSGYKSNLTSTFVAFDLNNYVAHVSSSWYASQLTNGSANFYVNLSSSPIYGTPSGMIALHPGIGNEYCILRFTAPKSASYYMELGFFVGNLGETDGYAILNNNFS